MADPPPVRSGRTSGRRGDRGATAVEYALLCALLVVTAIGAARALGDGMTGMVDRQAGQVTAEVTPP